MSASKSLLTTSYQSNKPKSQVKIYWSYSKRNGFRARLGLAKNSDIKKLLNTISELLEDPFVVYQDSSGI